MGVAVRTSSGEEYYVPESLLPTFTQKHVVKKIVVPKKGGAVVHSAGKGEKLVVSGRSISRVVLEKEQTISGAKPPEEKVVAYTYGYKKLVTGEEVKPKRIVISSSGPKPKPAYAGVPISQLQNKEMEEAIERTQKEKKQITHRTQHYEGKIELGPPVMTTYTYTEREGNNVKKTTVTGPSYPFAKTIPISESEQKRKEYGKLLDKIALEILPPKKAKQLSEGLVISRAIREGTEKLFKMDKSPQGPVKTAFKWTGEAVSDIVAVGEAMTKPETWESTGKAIVSGAVPLILYEYGKSTIEYAVEHPVEFGFKTAVQAGLAEFTFKGVSRTFDVLGDTWKRTNTFVTKKPMVEGVEFESYKPTFSTKVKNIVKPKTEVIQLGKPKTTIEYRIEPSLIETNGKIKGYLIYTGIKYEKVPSMIKIKRNLLTRITGKPKVEFFEGKTELILERRFIPFEKEKLIQENKKPFIKEFKDIMKSTEGKQKPSIFDIETKNGLGLMLKTETKQDLLPKQTLRIAQKQKEITLPLLKQKTEKKKTTKRKQKTLTIVEMDVFQQQQQKERQKVGLFPLQIQVLEQLQKQRQKERQKIKLFNILESGQHQKEKQKVMPRILEETVLRQIEIPDIIKIKSERIGFFKEIKNISKSIKTDLFVKTKRRYMYEPTLTSETLDIYGKKPKILTGISLRPKTRKKKKKVKKR